MTRATDEAYLATRLIVKDVCEVLSSHLVRIYMPVPGTESGEPLQRTSRNCGLFQIVLEQLTANISLYRPQFHNNKGLFSFVLLTVVDARYPVWMRVVAAYGKRSDEGRLSP